VTIEGADELTSVSDMTAVESNLDLSRLMSKISSKARQAMQYVKLDGLSVSEAALRSGMSESAVKGGGASWFECVGTTDWRGEKTVNTDRLIDVLSANLEPVSRA
jgi:hypothetical protein